MLAALKQGSAAGSGGDNSARHGHRSYVMNQFTLRPGYDDLDALERVAGGRNEINHRLAVG